MAFASDVTRRPDASGCLDEGYSDAPYSLRMGGGLLERTPTTASNRKTFTISVWIKRNTLGTTQRIWLARNSGSSNSGLGFDSSNRLSWASLTNGAGVSLRGPRVYRDTSAWYHIVLYHDSTASSGNRIRLYVNGVHDETWAVESGYNSEPTLNEDTWINSTEETGTHYQSSGQPQFTMSEFHLVDGQALTASNFGEWDSTFTHWKPKAYSGTHGTNGFYLNFSGNNSLVKMLQYGTFTVPNSTQINRHRSPLGDSYCYLDGAELTGDFDFEWKFNPANASGGGDMWRIGVVPVSQEPNYISTGQAGRPYNSTYWECIYGNPQGTSSFAWGSSADGSNNAVSGGAISSDVFKMTRTSGAMKLFKNGTLFSSFTVSDTSPMYFYFGSGNKDSEIEVKDLIFNDIDGNGTTTTLIGPHMLGADVSGNGNHLSEEGVQNSDQIHDSPMNNFATLNPTHRFYHTDNMGVAVISEGNLKAKATSNQVQYFKSPFRMEGKMYFEWMPITQGYQVVGFGEWEYDGQSGMTNGAGTSKDGVNIYVNVGNETISHRTNNGGQTNLSNTVVINALDVVHYAYDSDTGKAWVGVNGTWYGSGNPATGTNPLCTFPASNRENLFPAGSDYGTVGGVVMNFGQDATFAGYKSPSTAYNDGKYGSFFYQPPSGFKALCSKNLPCPAVKPGEHFNALIYTGNGGTQSITGTGFQPDLVWLKERSNGSGHGLFDVVRGVQKVLRSSDTGIEEDQSNYLTIFGTDGFTVGGDGSVNQNNETYVAWNWKAGGTSASNTSGSITSQVSANTAAGFSIISYTGTGSATTVGHGLSSAPDMIIAKSRTSTRNWAVYHSGLADTEALALNETFAVFANEFWDDQDPSSSVIYLGGGSQHQETNDSGKDYIAYCFHSVDGFSKIGSYTGNGSTDGSFIYTGFQPKYVLVKVTSVATHGWMVWDDEREPTNPVSEYLLLETANAEASYPFLDFTSNGFKHRHTSTYANGSGQNYIYMAFAEFPFKYANAR